LDKKIFVLSLFFVLVFSIAFGANPTATVSEPPAGTYWADGAHDISFNVFSGDANGDAGQPDLSAKIAYSAAAGNFDTQVEDINLMESAVCGSVRNFDVVGGVDCTYSWNMAGLADGNYFIDIKAYLSLGGTPTGDEGTGSSESFYVDNTPPIISVIEPAGVTCGSPTAVDTNERAVSFDLNDLLSSGIDVGQTTVQVTGQTSSFATGNCSDIDGNYRCTYEENGMPQSGQYDFTAKSKDKVGNEQTCTFKLNYTDEEAPAKVQGLNGTSGEDQIQLSWTANSESDVAGYKVYYSDQNCDFNKETGTYAGSTADTSFTVGSLDSSKAYYFKVLAYDHSFNEGTESDCLQKSTGAPSAPGAPNLVWANHSSGSWTSDDQVDIEWNAVTNATGYSCTVSTNDNDEPDQTIDTGWCQNRNYDVQLSNGTTYIKARACNGNDLCGGISTFTAKIDDQRPDEPYNPRIEVQDDGDFEVWWDESDSGPSGIREYWVYRDTSSLSENPDTDYREKIVGESNYKYDDDTYKWVDTEPGDHKGTRYYYRIVAVGNSGLESDASNEANARYSEDEPVLSVGVPEYWNGAQLDIRISSTNKKMENCRLWVRGGGDSSFRRIGDPVDDTYGPVTRSYTFGSDDHYQKAQFRVTCDNLDEEINKSVRVDTKDPSVKWLAPDAGADLKGQVELQAEATDDGYGINEVIFYHNGTQIGKATKPFEGNKYKVNWDVGTIEGDKTLRVKAVDNAGNSAEAELAVSTEKTEGTVPKADAEAAIAKAEDAKKNAQALFNAFLNKNLPLPNAVAALKNRADSFLISAKSYLSKEDYNRAAVNAAEAEKKFKEISGRFSVPTVHFSKEFSFAPEEIEGLVNGMVLDPERAAEALALLSDANAKRVLNVYKAMDGNTEIYMVSIQVTLKNNSGGTVVQIVEFIPKELAVSSDAIASVLPFEVLQSDPILKFTVEGVEPGGIATVNYYLKDEKTKEQIDTLNASGGFGSCNSLPLAFRQGSAIELAAFTGTEGEPLQAGFFSLGDILPWLGIFVVAVIAVFLAYLFIGRREPSEPEELSPLGAAVGKSHGSKKEGFFDRFGGSGAEDRKSKWRYEGE